MKHAYKILSVGGSMIIPKTGFDIPFLKKFRTLILQQVKAGQKFILVIGGGATCRQYQQAASAVTSLTHEDLDWIGIHTTIFNAQFVKYLFKGHAHDTVITNPTKKVKTNKPIIIAAGWQPGHSTDTDSVLLAKTYGVKEVVNVSNIEYVYTKDPAKYADAKPIKEISWKDFRSSIVGNTWIPGKSAPFDPVASKTSQKLGLTVRIVEGTNLGEVKKAIMGKKFKGTIIV